MKEIFLEYIYKYESGYTFLNLFGNNIIDWVLGILIFLLLMLILDFILLTFIDNKYGLGKNYKSEIKFFNYVDNKLNKENDENINLSSPNGKKPNIYKVEKYFLIILKNYVKFCLNYKFTLYLIIIIPCIAITFTLPFIDNRNSLYEDFYNAYLDETNNTVTYDIVEIKNKDNDLIVTYLDENNKLNDINLKRNDFTYDKELNKDILDLNNEYLGYIDFKRPIDIDYIKNNLDVENLDEYKRFFNRLEDRYSEKVFEKAIIFDLDYLN